ncbi:hypothetical protein AVEN_125014-1 [Araneus ventricosus]|uniref:Uncharacterized protein n=1 Tax=Araneus ventricosus TaxID=182803 RepID=A0A4Y2GZI4_ARAVE|nr:hypothetical protein AVEN_125014-1 [Araneus ventricosus]
MSRVSGPEDSKFKIRFHYFSRRRGVPIVGLRAGGFQVQNPIPLLFKGPRCPNSTVSALEDSKFKIRFHYRFAVYGSLLHVDSQTRVKSPSSGVVRKLG